MQHMNLVSALFPGREFGEVYDGMIVLPTNRIVGCAVQWLFIVVLAFTGVARAETLQDALTDAYSTNPQLQSERAHLRAVDEGVPQALSNWRPTVELSSSGGIQKQWNSGPPPLFFPPFQNMLPTIVDAQISQPLYRGGRTVAQTAVAEKNIEAERAKLEVSEESIFFSVIQAYLDVVRDQATLELSINNEQLLRKQLESTQEQFRVGTLTRTDVAQAQAQLASAVASRNQAEGNLQVSRANYERAVGHVPPKLEPTKTRPVLPTTRDMALTLAAAKNPNVIAAQFVEDASRDQIAVIRGQLLPTISVVGSYQRLDATSFAHDLTTNASVVAQISVPLYEGGAIYSQTRQAIQTVGQMQGLTDDARRAAVQSATQAWETIVSDRAQVKSLQETVKAAEVAFEGTQAEQRVGTRTILDVLITEQQLFTARVQLVTVQHDLALAEFNLAQQVGRLTAADLKLKVKLYDVNEHYQAVRDKWLGFGSGQ